MGIITLPANVETDRQNGIKANSVHVQGNFDALLTAVNNKLEKDGSILPTSDLPMNGYKITGMATPTLSGDAATKGYVDSTATNLQNNINTLDGAVVKLAGNQTIDDSKTFTSAIERTDNFSSVSTVIKNTDTNNSGNTSINSYYSSGDLINRILAENSTSGDKFYLDVISSDDGTGKAILGGTGTVDYTSPGSLLSTTAISKAQNGYVILGNGLIIQWGTTGTGNIATNFTVTYPIPFSGSNTYSLATNPLVATNTTNAFNAGANALSSTGFSWHGQVASSSVGNNVWWLAIGY